eukprot:GHVN01018844.1.p1 GENE.GHVN01018844.1~~GHVN01018844.1.p1  ORF type:complete len:183 (-),score=12.37 GHVN01018844.1:94-642(-)
MLTTFGDTSAAVTHANALHALRGKFSSISEVACERLKPEQSPMPEYLIADVSVVGPLTGDHGIWSQPAVGTQSVYVLVSFQAVDEELRSSSMKLWSMASVFRSFLSTWLANFGFTIVFRDAQSLDPRILEDLLQAERLSEIESRLTVFVRGKRVVLAFQDINLEIFPTAEAATRILWSLAGA